MTTRKSAANRIKDFKLAIRRIETGRSTAGVTKLNIVGVALEVGVSPSLIHNQYPAIAELIRTKQGASSRKQRDEKHVQLEVEQKKNSELRRELQDAKLQVTRLVTLNETLLMENKELKAKSKSANVFSMRKR